MPWIDWKESLARLAALAAESGPNDDEDTNRPIEPEP
jgi:hypothetical protein